MSVFLQYRWQIFSELHDPRILEELCSLLFVIAVTRVRSNHGGHRCAHHRLNQPL